METTNRRWFWLVTMLILVGSALALGFPIPPQAPPAYSAQQNRITSIDPTCANPGDPVTITGFGFGALNIIITVAGIQAHVIQANGHTATFIVPASAPHGPTTVAMRHRKGSQLGSIAFQVGCGGNRPPTANAGSDQEVTVGQPVTLDGRESSDPDGDLITYLWTLTIAPAGSTAVLSDPASVMPTFVPDRPGTYEVSLVVSDGTADSAPDTVRVSASFPNTPPTANAGPDQSVVTGSLVTLDGTGSFDPDGDPLTYNWTVLSRPGGSLAELNDPSSSMPGFLADVSGQYVIALTVHDGKVSSLPDDVIVIAATPNARPVADAGDDQAVARNSLIELDGSRSSDPNGDPLSYSWSIVSRPAGSLTSFNNADSATPTFLADLGGEYVFRLIVSDGQLESAPDTVVVTVMNGSPVANAGPDQDVTTGILVTLDGSGSADPDGDPLTYAWGWVSVPTGSAAVLANATSAHPSFTPDLPGVYTVSLTVSDGQATSSPDTAAITVQSAPPSNHTPVAADDTALIAQGTSAQVAVLASDSDPDGDPISITEVTQGMRGAVSHDGLTVTYTPVADFSGIDGFTYTISDGRGGSASAAVLVSVNRPPRVNAGPDQSIALSATANLNGTVTDDGLPNPPAMTSASWSKISGAGMVTFGDPSTVDTTATFSQEGTYVLRLSAGDGLAEASDDVTIAVNVPSANQPPVITSTPVTTAVVDQSYSYDVDAVDPDAGDTLTFSLAAAPVGMTIDPASGLIQWTPTSAQVGANNVAVRVQDAGGLFATQDFVIQVSPTGNHAPIAQDDAYEVRVNDTLAVNAPGILGNDTDPDADPLTAALLKNPTSGLLQFNPDGSLTYTPYTLREGQTVLLENVNLPQQVPGVTLNASGSPESSPPSFAIDGSLGTSWLSSTGLVHVSFIEIVFPQDVTVSRLKVYGDRDPTNTGHRIRVGIFQLLDGAGNVLFNSGQVTLSVPEGDGEIIVPNLPGVRRARFTDTVASDARGLAEFQVIGSAVVQRTANPAETNLVQLLATKVRSQYDSSNPGESAIDGAWYTNWYMGPNGAGNPVFEIVFPVDVTVSRLESVTPTARPDGFGTSLGINCSGNFELRDADDMVLFDSGLVNEPRTTTDSGLLSPHTYTLTVPDIAGVRALRYNFSYCTNSPFPVGFSEVRVFGSAPVSAPDFGISRKFQALTGREVHSTPLVANLTDTNGDGVIDHRDVPSIVALAESVGNTAAGDVKVMSGDDGRELVTMGQGQIAPWSEPALGDIDGDGIPDIIAVHGDGNHLIAFDLAGGLVQGDLAQLLRPLTLNVSNRDFEAPNAVDNNWQTSWLSFSSDTNPFFEIVFAQDIRVSEIRFYSDRSYPSGYDYHFHSGTFQLFAADGTILFDSGVVNMPAPNYDLNLPVPDVSGVRRVRFNGLIRGGNGTQAGVAEIQVVGSIMVPQGQPRVKWISDPNPMPRWVYNDPNYIGTGAVSIANLDGIGRPEMIIASSVLMPTAGFWATAATWAGPQAEQGCARPYPPWLILIWMVFRSSLPGRRLTG